MKNNVYFQIVGDFHKSHQNYNIKRCALMIDVVKAVDEFEFDC